MFVRFGCWDLAAKTNNLALKLPEETCEMRRRKSRTRRLHRYFQISQDDDHPMKTNVHVSVTQTKFMVSVNKAKNLF
jgi:hypothetical protein